MIKEKFVSKQGEMKMIKNANLICKNCKYKFDDTEVFGNTSKCAMYKYLKPVAVLEGKDCPVYSKE